MNKRPLSVTIIGWVVIVTSLFSLFGVLTLGSNPQASAMLAESPLPASAHQVVGAAGALISLVSGYGILKGFNWARILYMGAAAAGLLFSLLTVPMVSVIILGVLMLAVIAFFLFRPAASDWFNRRPVAAER